MNRGEAAEYAKRLRVEIRQQRGVLVRDMPNLRDLAKLHNNCLTLYGIADDLAEHNANDRNRSLFRNVADRALELGHLFAQLERTLEELSGVQQSPRQRRLHDEFERRRKPVLTRSREFEAVLDEFIRWATSDVPLRNQPNRRRNS
jgi:predicted unusual protein kinase regulating ubiquinone biosynthesis (AarF/ABC1/UbiB family)